MDPVGSRRLRLLEFLDNGLMKALRFSFLRTGHLCPQDVVVIEDYKPNNIKVIKSNRVRLTRHVARMGQERNAFVIVVLKPKIQKTWET
jgi:hypothetical protein